ncbi:MAG TPA: UDP-N-acetylmuramate--L-alanine ligase [Gemmatimonadaceae bacterium]|jgi:UDP-N-acetylmuramate--alanine ligase|nr:UDP-N-acetylmuramate--L-alanine ligase [Gemmatimonadaceae bacterium]
MNLPAARLLDPADPRPVHFVGIAGAGMSALAELFALRGVRVDGCDNHPENAPDLPARGITVESGHSASHVAGARALVVTSAMPKDHPELVRARELGIPVIRRAEALGEATSGATLIGVAGTHGKSTTTVMTTEALAAGGLDPTGYVGARVTTWGGNLRAGCAERFVVEADEYDRSFLALAPTMAIVTNVEADHLDIYADLGDLERAFAEFVRPARYVVLCADDAGANALPTPASAEVIRYGLASPDARLRAERVRRAGLGSAFTVVYDGDQLGEVELAVPGEHNVRNALAALGAGLAFGLTVPAMAPGLAAFRGVERRFQLLGETGGALLVDDYAHHPTEVRATIQAARAAAPERRLVVAFQPHLFSRTRDFAEQFADALLLADAVYLADIYPAREQPMPGVTSDLIGARMTELGHPPAWRGGVATLAPVLAGALREGDLVVTMGAGDVTRVGPAVLAARGARGS